ncbi:nuclear transport factor 2 family protein [Saccharopolyspora flava]|uniref:SnoaL-like domain-containing protein n=1 Tax=Saccharopolyspora flava TaxID=95161 RepID=A0A1I6QKY4_9PSEU|nr:nuclear transport factor 2 family protein [Saccharopolyspora flava]SFS53076.1 SnoaL-like domain-containing protein [Saccharopolyspora flava]
MIQQIQDRFAIEDVLIRYTRAIDTGEWDRLDEVFTPDARIDYTASGGIEGDLATVKPWLAENLPIFPSRMHSLHQIAIDHDGPDEARVAAYFHNPMTLPQGDGKPDLLVEFGGIYHHVFTRTPDGWRSRHLHEQICWKRGL